MNTRVAKPWRRRGRVRALAIVVSVVAAAALLAVSDRGRAQSDPLEECADYAAAVQRCFGARRTIAPPPPPKTDAEREVARKRCLADRLRIESACR